MVFADNFTYGYWNVKYKTKDSNDWKSLEGNSRYWYADPMLFEFNEKKYLFTEAFDMRKQKGKIAISEYLKGRNIFTKPQVIIDNPYHMSYPCVFVHDDKVYMIPETSQNRTLELYSPVDGFFSEWRKISVLLNNTKLVDTTTFVYNQEVFLIGYIEDAEVFTTKVYKLDMCSKKIDEIFSEEFNENIFRPAGNVISYNNNFYRPLQYNKNLYGESIRVMQFDPSVNQWFGDCIKSIQIEEIKELCSEGTRTHTLCYDGELVVLDILDVKQCKLAPFYLFRRRLRNAKYKIKHGERLF